jgi:acyl carrier protein
LLGGESPLDSLALVTFLVSVEEQIEAESSQTIRLVDERAMSRRESPFRTLGSLAEHISEEMARA